jgi:hypothetical protein
VHKTIALLHVILLPYIQDEIQGADVVSKALHYVFAKDRDFQDYLKSSLARHVTPTLRVRKVNVTTDRKRKPVRNAVGGVEAMESARVQKPI